MRTLLISTVLLTSLGLAQNQGQPPAVEPPQRQEPQVKASVADWIAKLGSESYRDRLDAEEQLRELGEAARSALEKAAADESDREVQWRARRLLRELDRATVREPVRRGGADEPRPGREGGLVERRRAQGGDEPRIGEDAPRDRLRPGTRDLDDMRAQFDRLFRRFERDLGIDVPRHRFFDDPFFQDLQSQLDRGIGQSQGMSVQIGPDGVRVEVSEQNEDGELERKVYEAPDMETFQQKYPDVLKNRGFGLDFGQAPPPASPGLVPLPPQGFDRTPRLPGLSPRAIPQAPVVGAAPPQGQRLGVTVAEVPAMLRDYLELDAGVGLMVEAVQEHTLAAALELRPRDIVTAINGRKIGAPADVAAALGAIAKDQEVSVEFVRRGERRTAKTKKQHDAAGSVELEPQKAGRGAIR